MSDEYKIIIENSMGSFFKLRDIEIYKESLLLAREIFQLTRNVSLSKNFSLVDQIRRASLSIPANIAEGYGRKSKRDFSQFASIALGSVNELVTYLDFIALEYNMDTKEIIEKYEILAKRIYSFRKYLLSHS